MTVGLRVYDPVTREVTLEITDRITRIIGSIQGNGSITIPANVQDSDLFNFSVSQNGNAYELAKVAVIYNSNQSFATVSNSRNGITTYVGAY